MHVFIFAIIPLMLLFAAPVLQIILSRKRLKHKTNMALGTIASQSFVAGLVLPLLATFIAICGISPEVRCITGIEGIAILGFMITFLTNPIIFFCYYLVYRKMAEAKAPAVIPNN